MHALLHAVLCRDTVITIIFRRCTLDNHTEVRVVGLLVANLLELLLRVSDRLVDLVNVIILTLMKPTLHAVVVEERRVFVILTR